MPHRIKPARPDLSAGRVVEAIACSFCGAAQGERCWNNTHGRQITGAHWQRRADLDRQRGRLPKLRGNVKVSFVCPICGGPHARADHV